VAGCILVLSPETLVDNVDLGVAPTWGDFLIAIPVGMVAYTGIETVSNLAEEARDYGTTIPRSIAGVVIAVAVIYAFLPVVALSAMPVVGGETALAGEFAGDPILGVVQNLELGSLQGPMEFYVGILAATILLIATNAGLIGVSRLTYSMGQHRQLPERLRQLHPRFRTPYVAILVFGLIACLTILPGQAEFLGTVYAFGAMLSFTIAHLAVIALRVREPDRERPYRMPGTVTIAGRPLPLLALFGAFGTGTAWLVVTVLNFTTLVTGLVWLAIGIATYVAFRRRQGLSLTQTAKVVLPLPAVEHEVEYQSILVAFEEGHYSPQAVSTAAKLAVRRRRGIHVLVTITVPTSAPIDAAMPEDERKAQEIIDSARVRGGRRVTGHWEKVRPGEAGRRIVAEAREIDARALVMPLPPRRPGFPVFNKTLEYVLFERPCRVIVEAPPGSRARAAVV
jgi:APA family basic amino acid/polyamine antiporter